MERFQVIPNSLILEFINLEPLLQIKKKITIIESRWNVYYLVAQMKVIFSLDADFFVRHKITLVRYVAIFIPFGLAVEVTLLIQGKNYENPEKQFEEDKRFHDIETTILYHLEKKGTTYLLLWRD